MKSARVLLILTFFILAITSYGFAQPNDELLIDDFEGSISCGPDGTVDCGAGGGSNVSVEAAKDIKYHGEQSLKINFDAQSGGYMWVSRGYGLDVKGAAAWQSAPKDVDFGKFNAISFWVYGANTNTPIALDLVDSGFEYWRYMFTDNFNGWKEFKVPFSDFFPRGDWQPEKSDKNGELNMPINIFQFEPRPVGKGTVYIDYVRLVSKRS